MLHLVLRDFTAVYSGMRSDDINDDGIVEFNFLIDVNDINDDDNSSISS